MTPTRPPLRGVTVARQLVELIDDTVWCRLEADHTVCAVSPVAASWPDPNPMHDLDEDPLTALRDEARPHADARGGP